MGRFRVVTRQRAAKNAKPSLVRSYMGRDGKHIAADLPDNPSPDVVDAAVLLHDGISDFTWSRCSVCEKRVERAVAFDGRHGNTLVVCPDCLKAANDRLDVVTAEETGA